ncbi:hypothetical protein [Actinomadura sp. 6N118]
MDTRQDERHAEDEGLCVAAIDVVRDGDPGTGELVEEHLVTG